MRTIFFLCLILFSSFLSAQNNIRGSVFDAETKEALPFVNIVANNGEWGVVSDIDGFFSLPVQDEIYQLKIIYLGYKTVFISKAETKAHLSIPMHADITQLRSIIITATEDPAIKIIQKVIENKNNNNPYRLSAFSYRSYNKLIATSQKREDSLFWNDPVLLDSAALKGKKNKDSSHIFISENVTKHYYTSPAYHKEIVEGNKISGLSEEIMYSFGAQDIQPFSFYDKFISLGKTQYLNPISKGSYKSYDFTLMDSVVTQKDTVLIVQFQPEDKKNFNGLDGLLYINTKGYALQNVIAQTPKNKAVSYSIKQNYQHIENKYWFPMQLHANVAYNKLYLGDEEFLTIETRTYIKDVSLSPDLNKRDLGLSEKEFLSDAYHKKENYWDEQRSYPLSKKEQKTYTLVDSIGKANNADALVRTLQGFSNGVIKIKAFDLFYKRIVRYTDYESIRIGAEVHTNEQFSQTLDIGAYYAYGLLDKRSKYGASLQYTLLPQSALKIKVSYINDLIEPGMVFFSDFTKRNIYHVSSVLMEKANTFESKNIQLSWKPFRRFYFTLTGKQFQTIPQYTYTYIPQADAQEPNIYNFTCFDAQIDYNHKEKWVKKGKQLHLVDKDTPSLSILYTRGISGLLDGNFDFQKVSIAISHQFRIKRLGIQSWQLKGGWVEENIPYFQLFHFGGGNSSNIPFYWEGQFQTMKRYEFTAHQFASLFFEQSLGKLLFRKGKFQPRFRLSHQMAWGVLNNVTPHEGINLIAPNDIYLESGLMIDQLFNYDSSRFFNFNIGAGLFFRYGAYQLDLPEDNLAFKIVFSNFLN